MGDISFTRVSTKLCISRDVHKSLGFQQKHTARAQSEQLESSLGAMHISTRLKEEYYSILTKGSYIEDQCGNCLESLEWMS